MCEVRIGRLETEGQSGLYSKILCLLGSACKGTNPDGLTLSTGIHMVEEQRTNSLRMFFDLHIHQIECALS